MIKKKKRKVEKDGPYPPPCKMRYKSGDYCEFRYSEYEDQNRPYKYTGCVCRIIDIHDKGYNYSVVFLNKRPGRKKHYYSIIGDDFLHITKKSILEGRLDKLRRLDSKFVSG